MVKIGDKVVFLNSSGGGIVASIKAGVAYIADEDGFEIPTPVNELVAVEEAKTQQSEKQPDNNFYSSSKAQEVKPATSQQQIPPASTSSVSEVGFQTQSDPQFLLAFTKSDGGNSGNVDVYVVNDSNLTCFFVLSQLAEVASRVSNNGSQLTEPLFRGSIEPHCKLLLDHFNPQRIDGVTWDCQVIFYSKTAQYNAIAPAHRQVKIKAAKFFKDNTFAANNYFNQKAIILNITTDAFERQVQALSDAELTASQINKSDLPAQNRKERFDINKIMEVDLHIEELVESHANMSNHQILELQIGRFEHVMREYENKKGLRIAFIHGVGNGVLKEAIRKRLDKNFPRHSYQDASFKEYGFGATMVTIR